jgi:hypothetical protein
MPRIYASNADPLDFCKRCFPHNDKLAYLLYGLPVYGEGPDGRGDCFSYDDDHPGYEDTDYTCFKCGVELTARDD